MNGVGRRAGETSRRALHDHAIRSVRDAQTKQLKVDLGGRWAVSVMGRGPAKTRELRKAIHKAETVDEVWSVVDGSSRTPDVLRAAMQRCGRLQCAGAVKRLFAVRPFESIYHVNVAIVALCRARDTAAAKAIFLKAFHAMDMPVDRITFTCALFVFASETPPMVTPGYHFCDQVWEAMNNRGVVVSASQYLVRVQYLLQTVRYAEAVACLHAMLSATRANDWAAPAGSARRLTGFSGFTPWQLLHMLRACNAGGAPPRQLKEVWAFALRANDELRSHRARQLANQADPPETRASLDGGTRMFDPAGACPQCGAASRAGDGEAARSQSARPSALVREVRDGLAAEEASSRVCTNCGESDPDGSGTGNKFSPSQTVRTDEAEEACHVFTGCGEHEGDGGTMGSGSHTLTSSQAVTQLAISHLKHGEHREALAVCEQFPASQRDFRCRLVEVEALLAEIFKSRSQQHLLALRRTARDAEQHAAKHWQNRPARIDKVWMTQLVAAAHRVAGSPAFSEADLDENTRWYAKALPNRPCEPLRKAGKRLPPGLDALII
ncbi:hypothetical protein DIPPA_06738 [Diplonema papillatum]|nr:hypothetical protein DIPPA_06738 [Diplonema papillatum]